MLRLLIAFVALAGLSTPSLAAQPSLLESMFKKNGSSSAFSLRAPRKIAGPIVVTVDITTQTMDVSADGRRIYSFDVSTGRKGFTTPTGQYRPTRMHEMWYSRQYDNSPMPYSIFFHGGYAIHGTTDLDNLGNVASHGCVRLHPEHAEALFRLVEKVGMKNTRIHLIRS